MRAAFTKAISDRLRAGKELYILSGDLGYGSFDEIRKGFPKNFINMGLAEQSMVSIGMGMALSGKTVYCYSILPFAAYRPFEQIRVACYNNAPIRVIGMGAGYDYDLAGISHFGLEDIQALTALPNITVLSPCDGKEVETLLDILDSQKTAMPVYMRLTKNSEEELHNRHSRIRLGEPLRIREGEEFAIISTSSITKTALRVAGMLEKEGKGCDVWDIHTLKPFYPKVLLDALHGKKAVITIEENNGGLRNIIASEMKKEQYSKDIRLIPFALPDEFGPYVGKKDWLLEHAGLSTEKIYNRIKQMI